MKFDCFALLLALATTSTNSQEIFPRHHKGRYRALFDEDPMSVDFSLSTFDKIEPQLITSKSGKSTKNGKTRKADRATGIFVSDTDPSLEIVSCGPSFIEVKGNRTDEISDGSIFIYMEKGKIDSCSSCSPLFRKVLSTNITQSGAKFLLTRFVTVSDLVTLGQTPEAKAFGEVLIEPHFNCSHTSGLAPLKVIDQDSIKSDIVVFDKPPSLLLDDVTAFVGSCNAKWLKKNADGRCTYTNCFVGVDGDQSNCFTCKQGCDNGCGAEGSVFNTDGNFGSFDFGPACCNHDFCYSSTSSRATCDTNFYAEMTSQCPPIQPVMIIPILYPILFPLAFVDSGFNCGVLASLMYLLVDVFGETPQADSQATQKLHEKEDICTAKCPTTQRSGGQGTTALNIDMLRKSGTFPVQYQMYGIPDQLSIKYEGLLMLDTGLVSGDGSASVFFNGTSKIITVTINAPLPGTAWDVSVGCPAP